MMCSISKVFVLSGACLIGGCVSNMSYPESWGPLPTSSSTDCRLFQGSYSDRAREDRTMSLTQQIVASGNKDTSWQRATRVDFAFNSSGDLRLTAWGEITMTGPLAQLATRTLHSGDFRCDQGTLVVNHSGFVGQEGVVGYASGTMTLYLTDKYLIAKSSGTGVGAYGIFPIAASTTHWNRFARERAGQ